MRFWTYSPRPAHTWLSLLGILLFAAPGLRAQDIPTPPDLWNLATGERIPGDDVLKTKDFGAITKKEDEQTVRRVGLFQIEVVQNNDAAGLQNGDIILAVDGLRIYGSREFELARFRNPLSTSMTLLINRKGDLQWLKFHDMKPGRALSTGFDTDAEQDRILDVLESLGLPLTDDKARAALRQLPAQAALELDQWSKKSQDDTAWLQDFIDLYLAVQRRHYADAAKPAHEPPIPYFQRLEKFYLALADENKAKEVPPELQKSGEVPEFYVLALPVPDYQPPLGDLKFSDRRFQALLARRYALGEDDEIRVAAQKYATSGSDGLDLYMDHVRASLLDPEDLRELPYTNKLVQSPVSRNILTQALSARMTDQNAVDWPIDAYAMIALDYSRGNMDRIAPLVGDLAKQSPYLARSAMATLYSVRHAARAMFKPLNPARTLMNSSNYFMGPDIPPLYIWAITKVFPVAASMDLANSNSLPDPREILAAAPYAELVALKTPDAPAPAPEAAASASPAVSGSGAH